MKGTTQAFSSIVLCVCLLTMGVGGVAASSPSADAGAVYAINDYQDGNFGEKTVSDSGKLIGGGMIMTGAGLNVAAGAGASVVVATGGTALAAAGVVAVA